MPTSGDTTPAAPKPPKPVEHIRRAVSRVNNAEEDARQARRAVEYANTKVREARSALAKHPHAPRKSGERLAVTCEMGRPGRGYWTFLVSPGGTIERVKNAHQQGER